MLQQYCMLKREIWICLNTQLPFAVLLILLFFWIFLVSANMRLHVQALSLRILLFFFDFPFGPLFLPFPYVSCPLSPSSFFPPRAHGWNVVCTQHTKKKGGRRSTEAQRKVHPWKFRCQEHKIPGSTHGKILESHWNCTVYSKSQHDNKIKSEPSALYLMV